jgi:hypothetical protein
VEVNNTSAILTLGEKSIGILAQSIGGGGNSGLSVAGSLSVSPTAGLSVSIGGNGGGGGDAGHVTVNSSGIIMTQGNEAVGIQAQSIGGGGGNGGLSLAGSFAGEDAKNLARLAAKAAQGATGASSRSLTAAPSSLRETTPTASWRRASAAAAATAALAVPWILASPAVLLSTSP